MTKTSDAQTEANRQSMIEIFEAWRAGISSVPRREFAAAIAIGALLRTTPYALLGDGLATGSPVALIAAASSIAIGAAGATLLLRYARAGAHA